MIDKLPNILSPPGLEVSPNKAVTTNGVDTSQAFEKALEIHLSKHALKRMIERGVPFDDSVQKSLQKGIEKAEEKGGQEALLLLKDSAYIVGIPKRQLITAFKLADLSENVFTNIDTAVIIPQTEEG
jgi:flagellar operon protein